MTGSVLHLLAAAIAAPWSESAATAASTGSSPFPPKPEGVTTVPAKDGSGSWLSYKETHICETTPGVKAYAGFVHLPPNVTGETFNINTFYWFIEARNNPETAPLSIYLAGGAGESSMFGAFGEGGPCLINDDYNSTRLNEWSWNNHVNMLYIDQPVQTGWSYDELVNGTLDQFTFDITPADFSKGVPETNETFLVGTFPSQKLDAITAGSGKGASDLWEFMQVWTTHFPKNRSNNSKISLWANSWGGFYATQTFAFFERQNQVIRARGAQECSNSSAPHVLDLDTLGITNGCIDPLLEAPHYPEQAFHNTYGYQAYSEAVYEASLINFTKPDGCRDLIHECRALAAAGDPEYLGMNTTVNAACSGAFEFCFEYVSGAFLASGRSAFDMAHQALDPFPDYRVGGFLNQGWVQQAFGAPLNFTPSSMAVSNLYATGVGDAIRGNVSLLGYVLQQGYKVAMVYGDRDYRCPWLPAENVSLSAEWAHAAAFRAAGYAPLATNASYRGGYTRQAGGFSFSRVFQAGHTVMSSQPETVYRIFQRAIFNTDVATGRQPVAAADTWYRTAGPPTVRAVTQTLPPMPPLDCDLWSISSRCSQTQIDALANGTAVLKGAKVIEPAA